MQHMCKSTDRQIEPFFYNFYCCITRIIVHFKIQKQEIVGLECLKVGKNFVVLFTPFQASSRILPQKQISPKVYN